MSDIIEDVQEEIEEVEEGEEVEEVEAKEYSGRKIMCFVSKQMVPVEDTIEVEYKAGESYRVDQRYVHFDNA